MHLAAVADTLQQADLLRQALHSPVSQAGGNEVCLSISVLNPQSLLSHPICLRHQRTNAPSSILTEEQLACCAF